MEIKPGMKLAPLLAAGGDPTVGRSQGGGIIGGLDDDVLGGGGSLKMADGTKVIVDENGTIVDVQ